MKMSENDKLLDEICNGGVEGWCSFDAKYGVEETLKLLDEQLKEKGVEVEMLETHGSWHCWRIISREEKPVDTRTAI